MTPSDELMTHGGEKAVGDAAAPLILTATMSSFAQSYFNQQRTEFFPKDRNHLDAHITLFHQLPGIHIKSIESFLSPLQKFEFLQAKTSGVRFLGRGVAYEIFCPLLHDIMSTLASEWKGWLTQQDRSSFKPHVTIQNKVNPIAAKALHERLIANFEEWPFEITGLHLWRYMNGPWSSVREYPFVTSMGRS